MHNIAAMKSLNQLNNNTKASSKSLSKLSTGLKINQAADDAAGLVISEKMRAQIRGLAQASRNIMDGVSLVQTAEGALGSIQDPNLLRLKELAVQSANGTLTDADRKMIQLETEQIKQDINEIANNTYFNGINLLNDEAKILEPIKGEVKLNWTYNAGSRELSKTADGGYVGVGGSGSYFKINGEGVPIWYESFTSLRVESIKETRDGGYIVLANKSLAPDDEKIQIIKLDRNLNRQWDSSISGIYTIEGKEVIETKDGSFVVAGIGSGIQNWDGIVAKFDSMGVQIATSVNGSSQSVPVGYGGDEFSKIIETADGGFLAVGKSSLKIGSVYSDDSSWIMKYDKDLRPQWDLRVGSTGDDEGLDAIATSDGGAIIVGSYNDSTKRSGLIYKVDQAGNIVWQKNMSNQTSQDSVLHSIVQGTDGNYVVAGRMDGKYHISMFNSSGTEIAVFAIEGGSDYSHSYSLISNADGSYTMSSLDTLASNDIINFNLENISGPRRTLELQVGPNHGETFHISLTDARTKALGIDDINLDTKDNANAALLKIDQAMHLVSRERSKFGAYQNTLEHIYNNISNYELNITSAESRIRDADVATEMIKFTQKNILSQAAQAMLAQANSQPQEILQLLK
ncbi:flagellin [Paenibacillus polysaccharolyticus]|uniref:flagellin n=1 Tax=Paenibacillus polysaccharolyticus TaxID=582692 RepID=UPI00280B9914|nr:flagellin [Paenibacillus polysaccharolyticus]